MAYEININSLKLEYPADFTGNYEYCQTTLLELADRENTYWTQNMQSGPNFRSSQGVCVYGNITQDKFTTFSIPDIFELIQIYAIEKGAKLGDFIDPQTGDIICKSQETTQKTEELSIETIADRSIGADLSDKAVVTGIFAKWNQLMKGLFKE